MGFQLKVLNGPLQGQNFEIQAGFMIGRGSADVPLVDAKISGQHAKIEKGPDGQLVMVDLNSRNGLQVNGVRKPRVTLAAGIQVQIGNTLCEVVAFEPPTKNEASPPAPAPSSIRQEATKKEALLQGYEYLADFAQRSLNKVKNKPVSLGPFKPLVVLTVTHGEHAGTEWILGYGPRFVGAGSMDLPILDSPETAFAVEPDGMEARFSTVLPEQVLLNERSVLSEKLNDGDVISFSATRIRVSFKE